MATIFHIAFADDWETARETGVYTTSTWGRTLAEVGFIHASRADQWTKVRDAIFHDATEPLVLLQIDTDLLDVPVIEEPGEPGSTETFPHIYGPLPAAAVVRATPVSPKETVAEQPEQPEQPEQDPAGDPPSFSRLFLAEMFFNLVLGGMVLGFGLVGAGVALAFDKSDNAKLIGVGVGLLIGLLVARVLFTRRHRAAAVAE